MASTLEVWTWLLNDLSRFPAGGDEADDYWQWEDRGYVTDVFNRSCRPKVGSLLIGYETATGTPYLRTLGQVASYSGVATGRVRAVIKPLFHHESTLLSHVIRRLPTLQRKEAKEAFNATSLNPVRCDKHIAEALLEGISRAVNGSRDWLGRIRRGKFQIDGNAGYNLREERDAIQTAISLTGLTIRQPLFETLPGPHVHHAAQLLNTSIFTDNEDDLLFADLRRFDRDGVLENVSGSTSIYRDSRVTLIISNVNRKPLERALGVDLLYWDVERNSYTFMQYKRLYDRGYRFDDSGKQIDARWNFTNKSDLIEQLSRMERLSDYAPRDASDWRLVDNPFWFKFIRPEDFDADDQRVVTGMYVPSSYLRVGLASNSFAGPRGGFAVGYWNTRYVTRSVFVELVKSGYSGSTSAASEEILQVISQLAPKNRLVVAQKLESSIPPQVSLDVDPSDDEHDPF